MNRAVEEGNMVLERKSLKYIDNHEDSNWAVCFA
jgi:hypothetical protein